MRVCLIIGLDNLPTWNYLSNYRVFHLTGATQKVINWCRPIIICLWFINLFRPDVHLGSSTLHSEHFSGGFISPWVLSWEQSCRADILNGLNVSWSFLQTEVKASNCSSWQESASAFKTQNYFANDMCKLWLNRFGSWDTVVKFDANNLYLQNNKRQT